MNKIFFTSDNHFGHEFLAKKHGFETVEEFNQYQIEQWNSVVDNGDRVYHLGDFIWNKVDPEPILKQLKGEKYLILGNHDRIGKHNEKIFLKYVHWIKDVFMLKIKNGDNIPSTKIWLSHYRHENWDSMHHGSFHFFGHEHAGNACAHYTPRTDIVRRFDVGAEGNNFKPYSFEEIVNILKEKGLYETDYAEKLKRGNTYQALKDE